MKNEINIDKVLFPDSDELTISEEGVGSFQIVDAELDGINCTIDEEDVVVIDVSDYKYISLTYNNILALENFIYEMNEFYENEN
jgi:uncharacterized protein (UPF0179 family)|tara:strand:- start:28 stop:279 length:252 start_codon:yes stop_codon:yes gene_type:complete